MAEGRRVGGILLIVVGGLLALVAIGMLAAGGVFMWADRSQRDSHGYLNSGSAHLYSPSYAIVATDLNLTLSGPAWTVVRDALGDVRITATGSETGPGAFIGIADQGAVQRYLQSANWDQLTDLNVVPFRVAYRNHPGAAPAPPVAQSFWQARTSGTGTQTLSWKVASGHWSVVLMNADASAGVGADVAVGATAPFLFGLALALLIGGAVLFAIVAALLVLGVVSLQTRRAGPVGAPPPAWAPAPLAAPPGPSTSLYPMRIEGQLDGNASRWLWLVKWLLLIPHYIVLFFLAVAAFVLTVVAFFAILFTGRYPRAIFDFNVAVLRWWWRVSFYGYSALATDLYPPFSFDPGNYPATLSVEYPEKLSRGLVLIKWWLLAIPHYLIGAVLTGGGIAIHDSRTYSVPYAGLITLLVLIAAIALLFTKRYPRGIFELVMGLNRWVYRVLVYVLLMRDEYPPFRLDVGGSEQPPLPEPPVPAAPPPLPAPGTSGV